MMQTFSITTLLVITTVIAAAFAAGQLIHPASVLATLGILTAFAPLAYAIVAASSRAHTLPVSQPVALGLLLFSSAFTTAYLGGHYGAGIAVCVAAAFIWPSQYLFLHVLRFLYRTHRSKTLWYLFWGYRPPDRNSSDPNP